MKTQRSFTRGWQFLALLALVAAVVVAALAARPSRVGAQAQAGLKAAATPPAVEVPKQIKIDLSAAVKVPLPPGMKDLQPAAFKTTDGKEGWVVRVPGGRPLATPAYSNGTLFVGGGYGSHEFYAFDAKTGRMVWKVNAGDDGPTAAVVEDGLVAFNTESCTLVVVDEKTGKLVWQEWLGDPLMSQPAVSKGKLFMAYPAGGRGHAQQNVMNHAGQSAAMSHVPKPVPQQKKEGKQDEQEAGSHR